MTWNDFEAHIEIRGIATGAREKQQDLIIGVGSFEFGWTKLD